MKATAFRVLGTKGVNSWSIDSSRVTLKTNSLLATSQFENNLFSWMKNAVNELGIDPVHHQVGMKRHNLFIYDKGHGEPYTLKFEEQPQGKNSLKS